MTCQNPIYQCTTSHALLTELAGLTKWASWAKCLLHCAFEQYLGVAQSSCSVCGFVLSYCQGLYKKYRTTGNILGMVLVRILRSKSKSSWMLRCLKTSETPFMLSISIIDHPRAGSVSVSGKQVNWFLWTLCIQNHCFWPLCPVTGWNPFTYLF